MTHTDKQKLKRVSFTMHPMYIKMLSDLAQINAGDSLSHAVRRLIQDAYDEQIKQKGESSNR